jgi:ABC-type Zn uptake system ZnuABC Zn-binding protein ZnuA
VHLPLLRLPSLVGALTIVMLAAVATGCSDDDGGDAGTSGTRLSVVATTSVLGDFAQQIGGSRVAVEVLLKPNVDAHDYEPSPGDIEAIRDAQVVVRNGVGLESWFDDTVEASETRAALVDASKGVPLRTGEAGAEDGEDDPHIWHDPRNAQRMVATIAEAFSAADPEGASQYAANLEQYTGELTQLDAEIEAQTATLPNKKLVTDHDAFGYYAARYGFDIVGSVIPSFDTSAELSAADLDDLVEAIRQQGVRAVFSETSLSGDAARTIADEAGVTVVEGEDALYGDGLGPRDSDGATYLAMMRHNTATIVSNLR